MRQTIKKTLCTSAITLSLLLNPGKYDCSNSLKQELQQDNKAQASTGTYFPVWYKGEAYFIPLDRIYKRTVKTHDSIAKWWSMENESYENIDVAQIIFLTVNNAEYYPKNFPEGFDLKNDELELIANKQANFVDLNIDGKVMGARETLLTLEEVLKITAMKNNKGELLYDKRGSPRR